VAEPYHVPKFGGGLNFTEHPANLRDDEWSWADGFIARDGYAEIPPAIYEVVPLNAWPAGYRPCGLASNPFDPLFPVLVGLLETTTGAIKLFKVNVTGTSVIEIPWDGVGTAGVGSKSTWLSSAFVGGTLVLCFGLVTGSGKFSLVRLTSDAGFTVLNTQFPRITGSLSAQFIAPFKAHVVAALCNRGTGTVAAIRRQLAWSAVNDPTVWDAHVSNDADDVLLDDVEYGITGLGPLSTELLGVMTQTGAHGLAATGAIPAFTRQQIDSPGMPPQTIGNDTGPLPEILWPQGLASTPHGLAYRGPDSVYLGPAPIADKIFRYLVAGELNSVGMTPYVWHPLLGAVLVPRRSFGGADREVFYYHVRTQAWARRTLRVGDLTTTPTFPVARLHFAWNQESGFAQHQGRLWILTTGGALLNEANDLEQAKAQAVDTGAFVDTKDFHFDDPNEHDMVRRIKVDWEPFTADAQLQVMVSVRNDLSRDRDGTTLFGTIAGDTLPPFVLAGILQDGASEVSCKFVGKYARIRFQQASPAGGRFRIRGFTILRVRAGQRKTSAPGDAP